MDINSHLCVYVSSWRKLVIKIISSKAYCKVLREFVNFFIIMEMQFADVVIMFQFLTMSKRPAQEKFNIESTRKYNNRVYKYTLILISVR